MFRKSGRIRTYFSLSDSLRRPISEDSAAHRLGSTVVADVAHWSLATNMGYNLQACGTQFMEDNAPVLESTEVKILWDHVIVHGQPDIVVLEKKEKPALRKKRK